MEAKYRLEVRQKGSDWPVETWEFDSWFEAHATQTAEELEDLRRGELGEWDYTINGEHY